MKKILIVILAVFLFSCEKEQILTTTEVEQPTVLTGIHNLSITDSYSDYFIVYFNGHVVKAEQTEPCKHKGLFYDIDFNQLNYVILND